MLLRTLLTEELTVELLSQKTAQELFGELMRTQTEVQSTMALVVINGLGGDKILAIPTPI